MTRSSWSALSASTVPSSIAPAAWITAVRGCSSAIRSSSPASWARSAVRRERAPRDGLAVDVEEREAPRMLGLGAPYESPERCRGGVRDFARCDGDGGARDDREARLRQARLGDPALEERERARRAP